MNRQAKYRTVAQHVVCIAPPGIADIPDRAATGTVPSLRAPRPCAERPYPNSNRLAAGSDAKFRASDAPSRKVFVES